ncbi:hypothetical protein K10PH82C1_LOCUS25 [Klebsiella phage vB_Kpn_K10PH82C1]|uniref:Uncharacterized protein n=1 Tax=Klebsiella phage vB_Kpn_K10PH82C1 TaxID=3071631 RepID=A0AAD2GST7_9CAUD|nr:hypothetical protein K10PH82C1_LOCUS25 [Klebsiella phage vB_Kpn_K10PH82C1]
MLIQACIIFGIPIAAVLVLFLVNKEWFHDGQV